MSGLKSRSVIFLLALLGSIQAGVQAQSQSTHLAAPEEIELKGNVRREDMASSLGRIELRWPRIVELLFGRTPQRAMADAAQTASRALKQGGFPLKLQTLDLDWKVVFMDEKMPESQIPSYLVSNCHPAWMTPPSNIYVVSQRAAAGCGSNEKVSASKADAQLAQILVHEIGHAVENQLLGSNMGGDRMRAEGFATWFERYASQYSAVIPKGKAKDEHFSWARSSIDRNPGAFYFQGSAEDYARASLYFEAVVSKRGVRGLMEVYELMNKEGLGLQDAINRKMGWSREKLEKEALRVAGRG